MPSKSRAQQRLFGMIHAYQTGKLKGNASARIREIAKHINNEDVKHFAQTKHVGLPTHVKAAFERGLLKRADEWNFPVEQAKELLGKTANFSESLSNLMNTLYPETSDSLINVADRTEPDSSQHGAYAKHMASNGIAPGAIGAGAGALAGLATAKDGNKMDRAGKGALLGGALGFGSGALHDAYHMGGNTRSQLIEDFQTEKERQSSGFPWMPGKDTERSDNNIDALKKSKWYEFYNPERIQRKLS